VRAPIAVLGIALIVACCANDPGPSTAASSGASLPSLGISNGTTLAVTLVINGQPVAIANPLGQDSTLDRASLPDLPWAVEARSPTGRVLTSMHVGVGDIWSTTRPGGAVESQGAFARVDLSCGSLRIWAGEFVPSGPAPASPAGSPGDCVP